MKLTLDFERDSEVREKLNGPARCGKQINRHMVLMYELLP